MTVGSNGRKAYRNFKCLLIDLDDTLYRNHLVPQTVREAIQRYLVMKLGVAEAEVEELTRELYYSHGTTMCGLVAHGHRLDYDDWHAHVHHAVLDYSSLLSPDPALHEILQSINIPKYIFTNADAKHTALCLDALGLGDCFQGIYDFERLQGLARAQGVSSHDMPSVLCKPSAKAYEAVLADLGVQPHDAAFFDDSVRNIAAAHALGIFTVLVGSPGGPAAMCGAADVSVPDMHHVPSAMPYLIDQPGVVHDAGMGCMGLGDMLVQDTAHDAVAAEPTAISVQA